MNRHLATWAALAAVAGVLGACTPASQPTTSSAPVLIPQGDGGYSMDHRRMGGSQGPSTGSPTLIPQGDGGYSMDHSRMGGSRGVGGGTPSVNPTGGGSGNAEFTHPGATGTGHAH